MDRVNKIKNISELGLAREQRVFVDERRMPGQKTVHDIERLYFHCYSGLIREWARVNMV